MLLPFLRCSIASTFAQFPHEASHALAACHACKLALLHQSQICMGACMTGYLSGNSRAADVHGRFQNAQNLACSPLV